MERETSRRFKPLVPGYGLAALEISGNSSILENETVITLNLLVFCLPPTHKILTWIQADTI